MRFKRRSSCRDVAAILALTLAIGSLLSLGMLFVSAPRAVAAGVDCLDSTDPYGSYFAGLLSKGVDNSGNSFEGAAADFTVRDGQLCDTAIMDSRNFHYVWSMIAQNESAGSDRGYAQSGYFRYYGSCTYWATEYKENPADTFHRFIDTSNGCISLATTQLFWVTYNSTEGDENLNVGSIKLTDTPWNPYTAWSAAGTFEPEFSGETKYVGSDMPGTPTATVVASNIQVQQYNNQFTSTLPAFVHICPWPERYARSGIASDKMSFFTYANSSTETSLNC